MTTSIQPGWYDDPEDANGQRYWDGQSWTPHRQRKPVSQPSSAPNLPPPQPVPAHNVAYPPPPGQQAPWQAPGYQPGGSPPQRSGNPMLVIGVIVAVLVLAVGGFFGYKHFAKKQPASPEDQIRTIVQREFDEFNASNFSHDPAIQCKANAASDQKQAKDGPKIRAQLGTVSGSVANIHVTGDQATADVTIKATNLSDNPPVQNWQFVKEDGSWKECNPPDSSNDNNQSNGDQGGDDNNGDQGG